MSKLKDRDIAKKMYIESNGEIALIDIAERLNKPPGTIRGWKSRYKWDSFLSGTATNNATLQKDYATLQKNVATTKKEDEVKKKTKRVIFDNDNLTDKQQLFCVYYLKYFNATKAYQKAYKCAYSTARVEGHRHLAKPNIKSEIERLKAERLEGIFLDSKIIMQQYIDIAFSDVTDFVEFGTEEVVKLDPLGEPILDDDGEPLTYERNYVKFKEDAEVDGTILSEIGQGKNGVKVKLHDKMRALDWLAKNLPEDNKEDLEIELLKARIDKEKASVDKIKQELDVDTDKPIEINIVSKKDRVGDN